MLDLSLFRIGAFAGANIVAMMVSLAMFGVFFFVSLYIQNILGYSPTQAGAMFLPMTMLIILVAPVAGRLSDRVGSRWLMGGGMTLLGISLLLYQRVGLHSDFWTLLPAMLVGGVGMAMHDVADDRRRRWAPSRSTRPASARASSTASARSAARSASR